MTKLIGLPAVLLAACAGTLAPAASPTAYYVREVRPGPGALVEIDKCGLDSNGQPMDLCYARMVAAASPEAALARQAARFAPPSPPPISLPPPGAPTLAEAMATVNTREAHAALESCRSQYSNQTTQVRFGVTLVPDGTVTSVTVRDALDRFFSDCVTQAVREMTFPAYNGPPASYDLVVAL